MLHDQGVLVLVIALVVLVVVLGVTVSIFFGNRTRERTGPGLSGVWRVHYASTGCQPSKGIALALRLLCGTLFT